MISHEMGARSRHQGGETSDEVLRFEQYVGSPIGEGMLELVDHQAIAINAQVLLGDGRARHVADYALELYAIL